MPHSIDSASLVAFAKRATERECATSGQPGCACAACDARQLFALIKALAPVYEGAVTWESESLTIGRDAPSVALAHVVANAREVMGTILRGIK